MKWSTKYRSANLCQALIAKCAGYELTQAGSGVVPFHQPKVGIASVIGGAPAATVRSQQLGKVAAEFHGVHSVARAVA
jgi:hypothetical protein